MWTLTDNKDWEHLVQQFHWVREMEGVMQDLVHHAEEDLATHTRMVLEELVQLEEYKALSLQDREVVWAAALLHDAGKPSTTRREQDGSISAKGHAKKGAMTTRLMLYTEHEMPFAIREQIVNLVRYHGLPAWAIDKDDPGKAVIEASLVADTKLLAILARANALGRVSSNKQDLLYRIGLFEALCKEHNCWGIARHFATANARFQYFRKEEEAYPDYVPFDDFGSTAVLLSGLPGAGKDSYVWEHYHDWPMINLNEIRREQKISPTDKRGNGRIIQLAKELARVYLRNGQNFVWNAINITKAMREQLVDLFVTYRAYVKIVYIEVPHAVLHQQNRGREDEVPAGLVERLITRLEVPAPWEAHEVIYQVR